MTERSSTRREFLGTVGVGGIPIVGGVPPSGVGNLSWTNATDAVPDHPFTPTPEVEWSVDTGDGTPLLRKSETDWVLYVGTPTEVYGLSTDGAERWRRSIASADPDFPVEVYPGDGAVYAEGKRGLHALDAADGHTRWRYDEERHPDVSLVTPETVFLHEHGLTALATLDGSERWRFEPDDPVWIHPHLADDRLYVGTIRGHLYALDAETGRVEWHADRSEDDNPPRFWIAGSNDETVFAWDSEGGELYGFDRDDGSLRWRFAANEDSVGFPGGVRNGTVYLGDGPLVRAISAADGTERWRYEAENSVVRWPKFDGRIGYFGTVGGVCAVSTTDGTLEWQFSTGSDTAAYVASVTDGTVIVDSRNDAIYALDADSGRLRWRFGYPGEPAWIPQIGDDTAYFASASGTVYALSDPGWTPLFDAARTVASPVGLTVGGLLGGALAVGAYRRHARDDPEPAEPTAFEDFELRDPIAETDRSEVHEALAPGGERVALERLSENAISPEEFADAVETWSDLDVPGVLEVEAWGTDPVPWVATELADASLADRADDVSPREIARTVADAAETVHRAHREGVTHGGLAPENVLFVDGEVRVGDWQLAAALRGSPDHSDTYRLATMADDLLADERQSEKLTEVLSRALVADPGDSDDSASPDDGYESALKFADALRWAVRR